MKRTLWFAAGGSRMRILIIAAILTAITALAHTASATVITYTLNNVDMNSLTTGSGVFAGS
jgi:hypothetical protein